MLIKIIDIFWRTDLLHFTNIVIIVAAAHKFHNWGCRINRSSIRFCLRRSVYNNKTCSCRTSANQTSFFKPRFALWVLQRIESIQGIALRVVNTLAFSQGDLDFDWWVEGRHGMGVLGCDESHSYDAACNRVRITKTFQEVCCFSVCDAESDLQVFPGNKIHLASKWSW